MADKQEAGLSFQAAAPSGADAVTTTHSETGARHSDAALLDLEKRFHALAAELDIGRGEAGCEIFTREVEAILTRLDSIERAIMETPAHTLAGLGVKARHAAYVLSQYWEVPIDRIDWDTRAVRFLIEAVCDVAHTPLLYRSFRDHE
ncbi:hypothetical protein [Bradyrhizobium sp.]|uniref:hypothetical protein n=1 Tax=Bradyrhizobium sp. TaxID=376 RepID=UPI003C371523